MAPEIKIHVVELANRVDPDVTAHDEPPHLDLHYLPMSLTLVCPKDADGMIGKKKYM